MGLPIIVAIAAGLTFIKCTDNMDLQDWPETQPLAGGDVDNAEGELEALEDSSENDVSEVDTSEVDDSESVETDGDQDMTDVDDVEEELEIENEAEINETDEIEEELEAELEPETEQEQEAEVIPSNYNTCYIKAFTEDHLDAGKAVARIIGLDSQSLTNGSVFGFSEFRNDVEEGLNCSESSTTQSCLLQSNPSSDWQPAPMLPADNYDDNIIAKYNLKVERGDGNDTLTMSGCLFVDSPIAMCGSAENGQVVFPMVFMSEPCSDESCVPPFYDEQNGYVAATAYPSSMVFIGSCNDSECNSFSGSIDFSNDEDIWLWLIGSVEIDCYKNEE